VANVGRCLKPFLKAETMKTVSFYVGLNSETLNRETVLENLNTRLRIHFDGFTISNGVGYWQGQLEDCRIVTVVCDDSTGIEIARDIAYHCHQSEVMIVLSDGTCQFESAGEHVDSSTDIGQEYCDEYDRQERLEKSAHIGHAGNGGVQGHSVGEIYPWHIVLIGNDSMELWGPDHGRDNPYAIAIYGEEVGVSFAECHRGLEQIAKAKIENDKTLINCLERFGF